LAKAGARADALVTRRVRVGCVAGGRVVLGQRDVEWTDAESAEFAESIQQQADRLDRMVANLLDLSRMEAGVLRPQRALVLERGVVRLAGASAELMSNPDMVDAYLGARQAAAVEEVAAKR